MNKKIFKIDRTIHMLVVADIVFRASINDHPFEYHVHTRPNTHTHTDTGYPHAVLLCGAVPAD